MTAILYPIAANADQALSGPLGRAAREREAARLAGEAVGFVREFTGPLFRTEEEGLARYAGRLDDSRPGARHSVAPEDRWCELKPVIQRSRMPFSSPQTAWRLSVAYWRIGPAPAPALEAPQARKARRQKGGEVPAQDELDAMVNQPLRPIKPQQPLDIGLFETRLPEAPHIIVPDE